MKSKYRYYMSGMFYPTDGEEYEINIPSPFSYETEGEAKRDGNFGYRFILLDETKGPEIIVYENEKSEVLEENGKKYLKTWVEGNVIKTYSFEEFKEAGGYIRMLKPELKGRGFIDGNTDFVDTDKSFKDVFPNMQKQKLYYIDDEAYFIEKIETRSRD